MRIDNVLIGQRIIIRNYEKSDLDFLTGMWFDEENGKYMSDPTAEYVDEIFQKALDSNMCWSRYEPNFSSGIKNKQVVLQRPVYSLY